eukprot:Sspe_Gene.9252::Locus_3108_Transcript_1_1_Confidence_1.000_Length_4566::g.9252::m.9252
MSRGMASPPLSLLRGEGVSSWLVMKCVVSRLAQHTLRELPLAEDEAACLIQRWWMRRRHCDRKELSKALLRLAWVLFQRRVMRRAALRLQKWWRCVVATRKSKQRKKQQAEDEGIEDLVEEKMHGALATLAVVAKRRQRARRVREERDWESAVDRAACCIGRVGRGLLARRTLVSQYAYADRETAARVLQRFVRRHRALAERKWRSLSVLALIECYERVDAGLTALQIHARVWYKQRDGAARVIQRCARRWQALQAVTRRTAAVEQRLREYRAAEVLVHWARGMLAVLLRRTRSEQVRAAIDGMDRHLGASIIARWWKVILAKKEVRRRQNLVTAVTAAHSAPVAVVALQRWVRGRLAALAVHSRACAVRRADDRRTLFERSVLRIQDWMRGRLAVAELRRKQSCMANYLAEREGCADHIRQVVVIQRWVKGRLCVLLRRRKGAAVHKEVVALEAADRAACTVQRWRRRCCAKAEKARRQHLTLLERERETVADSSAVILQRWTRGRLAVAERARRKKAVLAHLDTGSPNEACSRTCQHAVTLQRWIRGRLAVTELRRRQGIAHMMRVREVRESRAVAVLQCWFRRQLAGMALARRQTRVAVHLTGLDHPTQVVPIQQWARVCLARAEAQQRATAVEAARRLEQRVDWAVCALQRWARCRAACDERARRAHAVREHLRETRAEHHVVAIQQWVRGRFGALELRRRQRAIQRARLTEVEQDRAAVTLQRTARWHVALRTVKTRQAEVERYLIHLGRDQAGEVIRRWAQGRLGVLELRRRQERIRREREEEGRVDKAACVLQRAWRGHAAAVERGYRAQQVERVLLEDHLPPNEAAQRIQRAYRVSLAARRATRRTLARTRERVIVSRSEAAQTIQWCYRRMKKQTVAKPQPKPVEAQVSRLEPELLSPRSSGPRLSLAQPVIISPGFRNTSLSPGWQTKSPGAVREMRANAAIRIQTMRRCQLARRRAREQAVHVQCKIDAIRLKTRWMTGIDHSTAARTIQCAYRCYRAKVDTDAMRAVQRKQLKQQLFREMSGAAHCIQCVWRAWRRWCGFVYEPLLMLQAWWRLRQHILEKRRDRGARTIARAMRRGLAMLRMHQAARVAQLAWRRMVRRRLRMLSVKRWVACAVALEETAALVIQWSVQRWFVRKAERQGRDAVCREWEASFGCIVREALAQRPPAVANTVVSRLVCSMLRRVEHIWDDEANARQALVAERAAGVTRLQKTRVTHRAKVRRLERKDLRELNNDSLDLLLWNTSSVRIPVPPQDSSRPSFRLAKARCYATTIPPKRRPQRTHRGTTPRGTTPLNVSSRSPSPYPAFLSSYSTPDMVTPSFLASDTATASQTSLPCTAPPTYTPRPPQTARPSSAACVRPQSAPTVKTFRSVRSMKSMQRFPASLLPDPPPDDLVPPSPPYLDLTPLLRRITDSPSATRPLPHPPRGARKKMAWRSTSPNSRPPSASDIVWEALLERTSPRWGT